MNFVINFSCYLYSSTSVNSYNTVSVIISSELWLRSLSQSFVVSDSMFVYNLNQTASETLFHRSAFKDVIFTEGQSFEPEISSASSQKDMDQQGMFPGIFSRKNCHLLETRSC